MTYPEPEPLSFLGKVVLYLCLVFAIIGFIAAVFYAYSPSPGW